MGFFVGEERVDAYGIVPKDFVENLNFRVRLRRRCETDLGLRKAMIDRCREDVLFFFSAFCVAEGTPVVTDRGPVPIEQVTADDLVWDGEEWTPQRGALCRGRKSVILWSGIKLTPDHKVWTTHGWQNASKGFERADVRLPDGHRAEIPAKERARRGPTSSASDSRTAIVYDLVDCGPKQAFTVLDQDGRPAKVHNCWLHEPRPMKDSQGRVLPEVVPFIPWPHQEPIILTIRQHLGFEDLGVVKSRGEGMSWIAVLLALHDWLFAVPGMRLVAINVASRTEEALDKPGDMNALLPKLDWELERLPGWMIGRRAVHGSKDGD